MIDFEDVQRMLDVMEAHGLEEFELEYDGQRIRLRKASRATMVESPAADAAHRPAAPDEPVPEPDDGLTIVTSPIVGTFYRAPEPGSDPFVEVGSMVREGQVLCIIEAMKLMNEIDAEVSGEIVRVFIENGQPVQYGEKLFAIRSA